MAKYIDIFTAVPITAHRTVTILHFLFIITFGKTCRDNYEGSSL